MYLCILCGYLQRQRHAVSIEAVVERDESSVHAALRQIARELLTKYTRIQQLLNNRESQPFCTLENILKYHSSRGHHLFLLNEL